MSQDAPTAADSAFLASTDLCDADHPSVEKLALSLCETGDSPQDKAVKVYHHVRDEVRFRISQFADKASDTLASGWGHCYQKANLEVALATNRRIGIAVGILMCRSGVTEDQAFAVLSKHSQDRNTKVRELAEEVIYTGCL